MFIQKWRLLTPRLLAGRYRAPQRFSSWWGRCQGQLALLVIPLRDCAGAWSRDGNNTDSGLYFCGLQCCPPTASMGDLLVQRTLILTQNASPVSDRPLGLAQPLTWAVPLRLTQSLDVPPLFHVTHTTAPRQGQTTQVNKHLAHFNRSNIRGHNI